MKVLFDALKMPRETLEIEDAPQDVDESPCFCLLKDDRYIDHIAITTDRLMTPLKDKEAINDVIIIIRVAARVADPDLQFQPLR
jgi:hypothetical protein